MADGMSVEMKVIRAVPVDEITMVPLIESMDIHSQATLDQLVAGAPVETGHLRSSIKKELGTEGVTLSAEGYGSYLDSSTRYHYRSGPNAGDQTLGWWSQPIGELTTVDLFYQSWFERVHRAWETESA